MIRHSGQRYGMALLTVLALGATLPAAQADFLAETMPNVHGKACGVSSVAEMREAPFFEEDEEEDAVELNVDQLGLLTLYLLIGEVPMAQLTATTFTIIGGNTLPGISSSGEPVSDGVQPEHAPEPTTWLLGLVGGAFWGGAALVRGRRVSA